MRVEDSDNYFFENHLNDEAQALYADALVLDKSNLLPVVILNHVEECQQCKKEILAVYEVIKKEGVVKDIKAHPFLDKTMNTNGGNFKLNLNQILKYAAVFITLIGISGLSYYLFIYHKTPGISKEQVIINADSIKKHNKNHDNKINTKKTDSTIKLPVQHDELAVNLHESPIFENLVASNYRSSDVDVISPILNQKFTAKQAIVFKFKGDLTIPVAVFIYNNKGERISNTENISINSFTLDLKLTPGLYYWKLEKKDNLLYVGKFFVK
jgi:hypothetical protein